MRGRVAATVDVTPVEPPNVGVPSGGLAQTLRRPSAATPRVNTEALAEDFVTALNV
jgi:hypothetical protein